MSHLLLRHALIVLVTAALVGGCSSKKSRSLDELGEQQVEQLYNKGKRALDVGNYSFAIDYYRALEANYPYGDFTEQAKLDMLFAFDKLGQVDNAVEAADNFIKLYPTHKNVDYAYYMKGVASFEKKQNRFDRFIKGGEKQVRDPQPYRDSEEAFEELLKRYPNSIYAEDARQRIVYIRNALAERELAVANFYYDNQTYVAALNRCKTIVYEYETTPSVEGALLLMEKTYLEMGMQDLAESTHKILVANFPDYQAEPFKAKKKSIFSRLNPFK
ncbi:MAG: outer membrane protein assembly factor BamD [Arenicella sp.]|nr:outer membrane protein assembly factor BamD [Arenicella sp.]